MNQVIGDLLPVALGVAISPVPIIAVIVMLLGERPVSSSVGFAAGWVVGVAGVVALVAVAVGPVDDDSTSPRWVAVLKIVLGSLAVLLAAAQWRGRPRGDEEPALPGWMAAADHLAPARAGGVGVLLAGVNPKNLTLCIAAGATIGAASLPTGRAVVAGAVFVVVASLTVVGPVACYLLARRRMQRPLDELRRWLSLHSAAVMTVLLLVVGVDLIGKGVTGW